MHPKVAHQTKAQLKVHEGLRNFPYHCTAGKLTIGYGRNLDDVGISTTEAELLLKNDINYAYQRLKAAFVDFDKFTVARQVALLDMAFNLGIPGFLKFKNMIAAILIDDWETAADEAMDSRWYKQVGRRAVTVVNQLRFG